jgi:hypothetical protein
MVAFVIVCFGKEGAGIIRLWEIALEKLTKEERIYN